MEKDKVAFIGLDRMGFGRAFNLAKAGIPLTLFNAAAAKVCLAASLP